MGSLGIAVVGSNCGVVFGASAKNSPTYKPLPRELPKSQKIFLYPGLEDHPKLMELFIFSLRLSYRMICI
jgi:hypothetical protein